MGSKSAMKRPVAYSFTPPSFFFFGALYKLIFNDRVFFVEVRLILLKMVWNFDLEMIDPNDWNWLNQKVYLVFEPKALMVRLKEKVLT